MENVEQIVQSVKDLEERFLEKDDKTGDPSVDGGDTGEVGTSEDRYDEVEALMSLTQNSAISCMIAIEQMFRRGHKDKVASLFGEGAEDILRNAQKCLHDLAEMLEGSEEEPEESEEEESEEDNDEAPEDE